MLKVHSSRRAAGLKPGDYDHEINLVDHERNNSSRNTSGETSELERVNTASRLLPSREEANGSSSALDDDGFQTQERPAEELQQDQESPQMNGRPSVEVQVQAPTPEVARREDPLAKKKAAQAERETAIDILYENERGGFLCGTALFSSAALGGLDAQPWMNAYHKPSPTNIRTAQVPDPSWEWVWPEWRVNQQEGMDEHGWEYSFAYSKKFSWHGPKWWNSFVRRRAWTRKRAKKRPCDISSDPHLLNTDYFTVRPAAETKRLSQGSHSASRVPSKSSLSQRSSADPDEGAEKPNICNHIEDVESLLQVLRLARIDREKLEAAENYLENAVDLNQLQNEMHEIMSLFVFQASRRILLTHLTQIYDETTKELEKKDSRELQDRKAALEAAIKHADEETRKLAYWSDIKGMAENGETHGAVDSDKGWDDDGWQGVDQSGPAEPNNGNPLGK